MGEEEDLPLVGELDEACANRFEAFFVAVDKGIVQKVRRNVLAR